MPVLDAVYFEGEQVLPTSLLRRLVVSSLGDELNHELTGLGWQGDLIGAVALTLSADATAVTSGQFLMRGRLSQQPITLDASKIWEGVEKDVALTINPFGGELFNFDRGHMYSGYLPGEELSVVVTKGDSVISPTSWATHGVKDFCVRVFARLDKGSNSKKGPTIKYTLLAFGVNLEELEEQTEYAASPSWPGVKILEGACHMFPRPAPKSWGAPMLPILLSDQDKGENLRAPVRELLLYALSQVWRTAANPIACANRTTMIRKQQETITSMLAPIPMDPEIIWPMMLRPTSFIGKVLILPRVIVAFFSYP